jgi:hypothetical protein
MILSHIVLSGMQIVCAGLEMGIDSCCYAQLFENVLSGIEIEQHKEDAERAAKDDAIGQLPGKLTNKHPGEACSCSGKSDAKDGLHQAVGHPRDRRRPTTAPQAENSPLATQEQLQLAVDPAIHVCWTAIGGRTRASFAVR